MTIFWLLQNILIRKVFRCVKALDILPYHDMAKPKYEKLGMDYPLKDIEPATKEMAVAARKIVLQGFKESRIKLLQENK